MSIATITPVDLSSDELLLARTTFDSVSHDYLRAEHQLRQVLAKMGLFAPDDQLLVLMEHFDNKVSFSNFQQFLQFLKGVHRQPEARDADTLRAYVALGGSPDRTGSVNAEYLRFACKRFDLTIDIDKLIREVDTSRNGTIDYDEFQQLWRMGKGQGLHQAAMKSAENSNMTRSFWMEAVRQAHTATSEIEEELNINNNKTGNSLTSGNVDQLDNTANTSSSDINDPSPSSGQQQHHTVKISTLPESHNNGANNNGENEDNFDEDNEMPKADQLKNYLETGATNGIPANPQGLYFFGNNNASGAEHGRRKSNMNNIHASFIQSGAASIMMNGSGVGSQGDLRSLRLGGGGGDQSMAMSARHHPNLHASSRDLNNNEDDMMMNHQQGGGNNSSSYYQQGGAINHNYLPAADVLPDPNATPAEVLKKAKELIEIKLRAYDPKKESQDIDDKVEQMGKQRPPIVGGISISEKRGEGIDLPDPLTIGNSNAGTVHGGYPTSGRRAQQQPSSGLSSGRYGGTYNSSSSYGGLSSARSGGTTLTSSRSRGWR